MIFKKIDQLINYGLDKKLISEEDRIYTINRILEALELDEYISSGIGDETVELEDILKGICDYAVEKSIIEDSIVYRDLFDTKIMGLLTERPSAVITKFYSAYEESPKAATNYFYEFCQDTDYIRRYRIKKDMKWTAESKYGDIDITINLSKPEKDPKAIAAAKLMKQTGYPKCLLCKENEGYAGRANSPARQNHRIIPLTINNNRWNLQYSPYVYYDEHCILFNDLHTPMQISKATFANLLDFVRQFPHYFIGSNADLPIVGGSILTHDHFQGGKYEFAMAKAPISQKLSFKGFEDVDAGIVKWPMSTIRITCKDKERLIELADKILKAWRSYTDEDAFVFANTNGENHNTITPIARMRNGKCELDLVLRNNITTEEHPMGLYHPHAELHHIKKENIGLIEVMGLAVLPARLKEEMTVLADLMVSGKALDDERIVKHKEWAEKIMSENKINAENVMDILKREIGKVFVTVLEHAGVYKCTEDGLKAFMRFTNSIN